MKKFCVLISLIVFVVLIGTSICLAQKKSLTVADWWIQSPWNEINNWIVSKFEQKYPDVKIIRNTMLDDYYQTVGLLSMFASGEPPDIFAQHGGDKQVGPYAEHALDFTPIISSEKNWEGNKIWKETFAPVALKAGRMEVEKEKLYELPILFNSVVAWYNVDVFKKVGVSPPETWTELSEICQKIKNAGVIPIILGNKGQWQAGHWFSFAIQRSAGKKAYEDLMSKRKPFTDPDIVKAFSLIGDLVKRGFVIEGANTVHRSEVLPLMYVGKAAMEFTAGPWAIGEGLMQKGYNFDFFKVPKVIGGKGDYRVEVANKDGWLIYKGTKYKDEAIAFVKALTSFEAEKRYVEEAGFIPSITAAEEFLHPLARRIKLEVLDPAPTTWIYPEDGYEMEYQQFYQDAVSGVLDGRPVREVLAEVQKQAAKYQHLP